MKIIIIGASRGIGRELFKLFAEKHYDVIGTYCSTRIMDSRYYLLNTTDVDKVHNFAKQFADENIVLINCAGISYNSFAHKADLKLWNNVIDVNVIGTFNVIHAFLPYMRAKEWGRIVLFSSVVTKYPTPGVSAYATSKAAINGLAKSVSMENISKHITVNALSLGYTNVGMGVNDVPLDYQEQILQRIPARRFCSSEEIYNTIEYLIKTEYISGSQIDINGGLV